MLTDDERRCPLTVELLEYSVGRIQGREAERIGAHIRVCAACARVLRNLSTGSAGPTAGPQSVPAALTRPDARRAARMRAALAQRQPSTLALGQIWRTRVTDGDAAEYGPYQGPEPRLVVVLHADDQPMDGSDVAVVVAPVSIETAYRSNFDLMVEEDESPLPFASMIEVWNEVSTVASRLTHCLGVLPEHLQSLLSLLYRARLGAEVDLRPLAGRIGPVLHGKGDPRLEFREREIDACAYLRRPLLEHVFASAVPTAEIRVSTLGELVDACEGSLADLVPAAALDTLREDPTPVAELQDPARQAKVVGEALQRAAVPLTTRRDLFNRLREELAFFQPQRSGDQLIFTRRQR